MPRDITAELHEILAAYDLGELVDYEKNDTGFVNSAFAVILQAETEAGPASKRYFLRKYKRGIREEELAFEHTLVDKLVESETCPVAKIYKTLDGKSFLKRFEGEDDTQGVYYTLFDYLPGEDRYTWVDPRLQDRELEQAAVILARFHNGVRGFTPAGRRAEPKILELLPLIEKTWLACPGQSKGTEFDAYLLEHLELVEKNLRETMAALLRPEVEDLAEVVIHCDFHPGNLKYEGDRVIGLFDFDWSKVDKQVFDLALALWYFCTSWEAQDDGRFRLEWARVFLDGYQQFLRENPGVCCLSEEEIAYLPMFINASNLYVLNWTILDYYHKTVDVEEYLRFLKHHINFVRWFEKEENRSALEEVAKAFAVGRVR